jgi:hypothetical protein
VITGSLDEGALTTHWTVAMEVITRGEREHLESGGEVGVPYVERDQLMTAPARSVDEVGIDRAAPSPEAVGEGRGLGQAGLRGLSLHQVTSWGRSGAALAF